MLNIHEQNPTFAVGVDTLHQDVARTSHGSVPEARAVGWITRSTSPVVAASLLVLLRGWI